MNVNEILCGFDDWVHMSHAVVEITKHRASLNNHNNQSL